jgi:hypothetical protein
VVVDAVDRFAEPWGELFAMMWGHINLDAFLRTPTSRRFYDSLALLAVTAALRGVEERPFEAGGTAGMGRVVRELDGIRAGGRGAPIRRAVKRRVKWLVGLSILL